MTILKKTGSLLLFLIMIGIIIWDSTYFAEKELKDKRKNSINITNIQQIIEIKENFVNNSKAVSSDEHFNSTNYR